MRVVFFTCPHGALHMGLVCIVNDMAIGSTHNNYK